MRVNADFTQMLMTVFIYFGRFQFTLESSSTNIKYSRNNRPLNAGHLQIERNEAIFTLNKFKFITVTLSRNHQIIKPRLTSMKNEKEAWKH